MSSATCLRLWTVRSTENFSPHREALPARTEYAALRSFYHCQATLYGTTTLLRCYAKGTISVSPEHAETYPKEDYVNKESLGTGYFIVSVDPEGVLKWSSNVLAKKGRPAAHIIEALTERAAPSYLCYLRRLGISYVFAGKARLDCALLLQKLRAYFDIRRLMLAGGGTMNWSFLQEGLIDELSLVIAPVADGKYHLRLHPRVVRPSSPAQAGCFYAERSKAP